MAGGTEQKITAFLQRAPATTEVPDEQIVVEPEAKRPVRKLVNEFRGYNKEWDLL